MTKTNDERILLLKKQIEDKKVKLGKSMRFAPITNCSIELDGERHNINVSDKNGLMMFLVRVNSLKLSAVDLGLNLDEFIISGYPIEDWITDINSKLDVIAHKDEERKLKLMEDKLVKLLSEGKKVELEIDEIESLLN